MNIFDRNNRTEVAELSSLPADLKRSLRVQIKELVHMVEDREFAIYGLHAPTLNRTALLSLMTIEQRRAA